MISWTIEMILYEFKCPDGHKFEAWKPLEDRFSAICPECGEQAKKVFSIPNVTWTWVLDGLTHDNPRRYHEPYIL